MEIISLIKRCFYISFHFFLYGELFYLIWFLFSLLFLLLFFIINFFVQRVSWKELRKNIIGHFFILDVIKYAMHLGYLLFFFSYICYLICSFFFIIFWFLLECIFFFLLLPFDTKSISKIKGMIEEIKKSLPVTHDNKSPVIKEEVVDESSSSSQVTRTNSGFFSVFCKKHNLFNNTRKFIGEAKTIYADATKTYDKISVIKSVKDKFINEFTVGKFLGIFSTSPAFIFSNFNYFCRSLEETINYSFTTYNDLVSRYTNIITEQSNRCEDYICVPLESFYTNILEKIVLFFLLSHFRYVVENEKMSEERIKTERLELDVEKKKISRYILLSMSFLFLLFIVYFFIKHLFITIYRLFKIVFKSLVFYLYILFTTVNFLIEVIFSSSKLFNMNQRIFFFDLNRVSNNNESSSFFVNLFCGKNQMPIILNPDIGITSSFFLKQKSKKGIFNNKKYADEFIKNNNTFSNSTKVLLSNLYERFVNGFPLSFTRKDSNLANIYIKNKSIIFNLLDLFFNNSSIEQLVCKKDGSNEVSFFFYIGFYRALSMVFFQHEYIENSFLLFLLLKFLSNNVIFFSNSVFCAYDNSNGIDLRSEIECEIKPGELKTIPLDMYMHIPNSFFAQICPRSSVSRNSLLLINSPGTCDSLYQGKINIDLINMSRETKNINIGDRVAQAVIIRHKFVNFSENKIINLISGELNSNRYGLFDFLISEVDKEITMNFSKEHKDSIFCLVNDLFLNKRKSKGFGSSGK